MGEFFVNARYSRFASGYCFLFCEEMANNFFVYVRQPSFVPARPAYAGMPALVVAAHGAIGLILGRRRKPQIVPTVVGGIKVFVVNFFWRPFASLHQPNQSMCTVVVSVDAEANAVIGAFPSGYRTGAPTLGKGYFPTQQTGFGVIIKDGPDILSGQIVAGALMSTYRLFSHLALQWQAWSGSAASVYGARPTRPFYRLEKAA